MLIIVAGIGTLVAVIKTAAMQSEAKRNGPQRAGYQFRRRYRLG